MFVSFSQGETGGARPKMNKLMKAASVAVEVDREKAADKVRANTLFVEFLARVKVKFSVILAVLWLCTVQLSRNILLLIHRFCKLKVP